MAKDVRVDTKISSSRSVGDAIGYTIEGKPHNNDNGKIKNRAVMIRGLNVSDNPHIARIEMNNTLSKAGIHKNNVHCLREIKSYKFLDYRSKRDRQLGMKMDLEMMQKEHPHCQILAVMHIDGVHHHIHIHNIICTIDPTMMKSITHRQTSWIYHLRPITNKVMAQNGFPNQSTNLHSPKKRSRNVIYHIKKGDSWVGKIQDKLDYARFHATNPLKYIQLVKQQGIGIECFKMHTVNGKREIHYYKNPSKSPKIIQHRVINGKHKGEFVHERKHFSYDIQFNGKKYKIRDKKLGSDFSKHNLLRQFRLNRQQQLHPSSKITSNRPIQSNSKQNQHPKTASHQQSEGIQPVITRAKNDESGKKAIHSIEHKPSNTSIVRTNKLLHNPKYFHLHGSLTVYPHVQTIHSTLNNGTSINIPHHIPKRIFHLAMIRMPHMPHFVPLVAYLGTKGDDDTKQAIVANLDQNIIDENERTYNDYLDNVATTKDLNSNRRAQNKDVAMSDRDRSREILKERIAEARSMHR